MYIDDFIWLPDVVEKIESKHNLTQDEVEEVFFNIPKYRFIESGYRQDEDVYSASGQADAGRYLTETRSLIWFAVNDGKFNLTDEQRTEVLDLLQQEVIAATNCFNDLLYCY